MTNLRFQPLDTKPYVTVATAMELLNRSRQQVHNLINNGTFQDIRQLSTNEESKPLYFIHEDEIEAELFARETGLKPVYIKSLGKHGLTPARIKELKLTYNLTPDHWLAMFNAQKGKCFGCKEDHTAVVDGLSVDHDHRCCMGKKSCGECVRGLLCKGCNGILGSLERSISLRDDICPTLHPDQYDKISREILGTKWYDYAHRVRGGFAYVL